MPWVLPILSTVGTALGGAAAATGVPAALGAVGTGLGSAASALGASGVGAGLTGAGNALAGLGSSGAGAQVLDAMGGGMPALAHAIGPMISMASGSNAGSNIGGSIGARVGSSFGGGLEGAMKGTQVGSSIGSGIQKVGSTLMQGGNKQQQPQMQPSQRGSFQPSQGLTLVVDNVGNIVGRYQ